MSTLWEDIYKVFYNKIEKDRKFFSGYNISQEEILEIVKERSKALLLESISRLTLFCTPDVDFSDYNDVLEQFNFDLTKNEIDIIASIMREKVFDRDKSLLKVFEQRFTTKDLNVIGSPANERKTFVDMCKEIENQNNKLIKSYISKDRLTGQFKMIDYSKYNDY